MNVNCVANQRIYDKQQLETHEGVKQTVDGQTADAYVMQVCEKSAYEGRKQG